MLFTQMIILFSLLSIILQAIIVKNYIQKKKKNKLIQIIMWCQVVLLCLILIGAVILDSFIQLQSRIIHNENNAKKSSVSK